jgi:hypothetical protein
LVISGIWFFCFPRILSAPSVILDDDPSFGDVPLHSGKPVAQKKDSADKKPETPALIFLQKIAGKTGGNRIRTVPDIF